MRTAWIVLFVAGLFETAWAVGLAYADGFSEFWPSVGTIVALILSMALLAQAVRSLPVGTAYAVWTGIGTLGTVVYGIAVFGESAAPLRLLFVGCVLVGIVGLHQVA